MGRLRRISAQLQIREKIAFLLLLFELRHKVTKLRICKSGSTSFTHAHYWGSQFSCLHIMHFAYSPLWCVLFRKLPLLCLDFCFVRVNTMVKWPISWKGVIRTYSKYVHNVELSWMFPLSLVIINRKKWMEKLSSWQYAEIWLNRVEVTLKLNRG